MMIAPFKKKNREVIFFESRKTILVVSILLIIFSYFFADITVATYFKTLSPQWKTFVAFITKLIDPKYHSYIWPILFFFIYYISKQQILGNRLLLILISIPMANFFVWVIKWLFGRARPELLFSQHFYGFTFFNWAKPFESFPSGHACTIGALCGAIACFYPRWSFPLMFLGFFLALSRVALHVHFLSDIIAGLALGMVVSQWIYMVMKKRGTQFEKLTVS